MRVSVVVPVFDPGSGFDELIHSVDQQTLTPEEFEVILCDDGSDKATRDRLAQVAHTRPNVRVLTLAHTGWPGTPRNHGIQAARGEYVFFADQDDRLFPDALQHLCDYADRHSSDVVVGKVIGVGRRIPRQIFRRDVPRAVLGQDPLLELLTPHKLFRTSFLNKHGIRFPDGRVRLEDHLFVMRAYFAAGTISILASQPCYAWLKNAGSASSSRIDPVTYFPHLETVLDLVEANTEPGEPRDTLLRHWYRGKILKRLDANRMLRYPDDYRTRFLDVVIPLAQRRFGPGVQDGLPFPLRIRSALVRAGRVDELLRLAQFESELTCQATVVSARWTRGGRLALTVQVRIVRDGQDALIFDPPASPTSAAGHRSMRDQHPSIWQPPDTLDTDFLPPDALNARRDLRHNRVELFLHDSADDSERRLPGRASHIMTPARLTIDPVTAFGRQDPATGGQLVAHVRYAGWTLHARLRVDQETIATMKRSPILAGARIGLFRREDGTVELRRDAPTAGLRNIVAHASRSAGRLARKAIPQRARKLLIRWRDARPRF